MPEEVLYILFIAMVAVIMVNIVCTIGHKRAKKKFENLMRCLLFGHRIGFWKELGAYKAAEGNKLYFDLKGIRLVIENGEIEGWYEP